VNTSVTSIDFGGNGIGAEGIIAIADALKVNMTVMNIRIDGNEIGAEGASALVDALKVNTSVTKVNLSGNEIDASGVNKLIARNERLRQLFLFDARKMLLTVLCADECGALWPYLLEGDDLGVIAPPANVESLRAEFAAVVEERRRRELCRPVLVADFRVLQREIAGQSNQIATLNDIVRVQASENAQQTTQIAEQTNQIAAQTSQIADLQRLTETMVEQNRQMYALLMSREQGPSVDVDERDKRAAKRRRTGR
jgi:hypothetical protein